MSPRLVRFMRSKWIMRAHFTYAVVSFLFAASVFWPGDPWFWPRQISFFVLLPFLGATTILSSRIRRRLQHDSKQLDFFLDEFGRLSKDLAHKILNGQIGIAAVARNEEEAEATMKETDELLNALRNSRLRLKREFEKTEQQWLVDGYKDPEPVQEPAKP